MKKKIISIIFTFVIALNAFFVPVLSVRAQENSADVDYFNDYESRLQQCGIVPGSAGSLEGCIVRFVYFGLLTPSAWFARVTGEVFDWFVHYSLDTNSYKGQGDFIERGWSIIRDIGNVLFIFALLYIAISHILQFSTSNTKKFLVNLIIAALLINFSLFFSRVIIDAGNILARAFYNNIEIVNDDNLEYKTISQGIVAHVNPQRILGSELFTPKQTNSAEEAPTNMVSTGYTITVLLMGLAVNVVLGITFLSVCLLFIGRVVGLWFLMIFSPFAFASISVPDGKGIFGDFSMSGWLNQIMKLSFMAPVFLFFLFLLIMFLQVVFQTNITDVDQSTVSKFMSVLIPFAMVIFILNKAKKVATDLAGEAGGAIKSIVGKAANFGLGAVGLAGGAVLAGGAWVGRNTIGVAAADRLRSGRNQERVRLYSGRAEDAEKRSKDLNLSAEDRRQAASEASKHRRTATLAAMQVRKDAYLAKKATFDARRSTLLQSAIGSGVGKNVAGKLGDLSKEAFGGEKVKLGFGKGSDMTQSKYEEKQTKKAEEIAKNYKESAEEKNVKAITESVKKGAAGKAEAEQNMEKYLKQIADNDLLTDTEKAERIRSVNDWKSRLAAAGTDEEKIRNSVTQRNDFRFVVNSKGETVREQYVAATALKDIVGKNTMSYGYGSTKGNDPLYKLALSESALKESVEKLRKGAKGDLEKSMKDLIKEAADKEKHEKGDHDKDKDKGGHKKDDDHGHAPAPAPKPAAPKPSAPAPSAPPSGGGGHDNHAH